MKVSIVGLLGVLFVGLKLGGVIDWSWWLITLPFWGGLVLLASLFLIGFVAGLVVLALGYDIEKR